MIVYGDEVDKEGSTTNQSWQQESTKNHLFDPYLSTQPSIEASAEITINRTGCCVDKDGCTEQGPSPAKPTSTISVKTCYNQISSKLNQTILPISLFE